MKHRPFTYSALVLWLLLILSPSASCQNSATLSLQYDSFSYDEDKEISGIQMALPLHVSYSRGPLAVALMTAYADATVSLEEQEDATLSGMTDTLVSLNYSHTFRPQSPIKAILNLEFNLPTGEEQLDAAQAIAESKLRGDGDLFRIDDFGEGFNVGATLGLERQMGANTIGLYGGYIYYGAYNPSSEEPDYEYDPGDEIFAAALYEWKGSPRDSWQVYLGYSYFDTDQEDGTESLKIGDKLSAGANFQAGLGEALDVSLALQYIMQFKSEEALDGEMSEESENSNGSEFFASLALAYQLHPRFNLQLLSELRYYGESDRKREDLDLPYESLCTRYSIGPGLEYQLSPSVALRGRGSYFHLNYEPDASFTADGTYQGMNLDMGALYTF